MSDCMRPESQISLLSPLSLDLATGWRSSVCLFVCLPVRTSLGDNKQSSSSNQHALMLKLKDKWLKMWILSKTLFFYVLPAFLDHLILLCLLHIIKRRGACSITCLSLMDPTVELSRTVVTHDCQNSQRALWRQPSTPHTMSQHGLTAVRETNKI